MLFFLWHRNGRVIRLSDHGCLKQRLSGFLRGRTVKLLLCPIGKASITNSNAKHCQKAGSIMGHCAFYKARYSHLGVSPRLMPNWQDSTQDQNAKNHTKQSHRHHNRPQQHPPTSPEVRSSTYETTMPWTSPVQQLAKQSARLARKARRILGCLCASCDGDHDCMLSRTSVVDKPRRWEPLTYRAHCPKRSRDLESDLAFTAVELYPRDERVRRRDRPFVITTTTPASSTTLTATMDEVHE